MYRNNNYYKEIDRSQTLSLLTHFHTLHSSTTATTTANRWPGAQLFGWL